MRGRSLMQRRACTQPAAPPPSKRKAERDAAADAAIKVEDKAIAALALTLLPALLAGGIDVGLQTSCRAAVFAAWEQNGSGSAETEGPGAELRTQRLADRVRKQFVSRRAARPEASDAGAAPAVPGAGDSGGGQIKKRKKAVEKRGPAKGTGGRRPAAVRPPVTNLDLLKRADGEAFLAVYAAMYQDAANASPRPVQFESDAAVIRHLQAKHTDRASGRTAAYTFSALKNARLARAAAQTPAGELGPAPPSYGGSKEKPRAAAAAKHPVGRPKKAARPRSASPEGPSQAPPQARARTDAAAPSPSMPPPPPVLAHRSSRTAVSAGAVTAGAASAGPLLQPAVSAGAVSVGAVSAGSLLQPAVAGVDSPAGVPSPIVETPGATPASDPPLSSAGEDIAAAAATRAGVRPIIDIAALEDEDGVAVAVEGQSMLTKIPQTTLRGSVSVGQKPDQAPTPRPRAARRRECPAALDGLVSAAQSLATAGAALATAWAGLIMTERVSGADVVSNALRSVLESLHSGDEKPMPFEGTRSAKTAVLEHTCILPRALMQTCLEEVQGCVSLIVPKLNELPASGSTKRAVLETIETGVTSIFVSLPYVRSGRRGLGSEHD